MTKPIIGISGTMRRDDGGPFVDLNRSYVNEDYTKSVEEAGAIPVIIPFTTDLDIAKETVQRLDGLVMSGGHDVYPLHYGEEPLQAIGDVWPERDQFDFALLAAAESLHIPVLAICRGMQILNVYRGGTLYQDLSYDANCTIKHSQNQTPSLGTHTVTIDENSKLASIIGTTSWVTNSHHHQTAKDIGRNLVIAARAKDGTVEALEDPTRPWFIGCQFHPEMMHHNDTHAKQLFLSFVEACRK